MNTLKHKLSTALLLLLLSWSSHAELKPYTAIYDVYASGFHLGEATQTLEQREDTWVIKLVTEATGFASFFQSNPAVEEQTFKLIGNTPELISAKSDSGEDEEDAKKSAYYDSWGGKLLSKIGHKNFSLKVKHSLTSYLLLQMSITSLIKDKETHVTIYDDGKTAEKIISLQTQGNGTIIADIYSAQSNKKLRYIFKDNHQYLPFRIERFNGDEITAYLELERFN